MANTLGAHAVRRSTRLLDDTMNRRKRWVLLLGMAIVLFGASAAWWTGFLYSDSCYDAGGIMREGVCVASRFPVPWLWEAPWHRMAFSLVPPAVLAVIVTMIAWIAGEGVRRDV